MNRCIGVRVALEISNEFFCIGLFCHQIFCVSDFLGNITVLRGKMRSAVVAENTAAGVERAVAVGTGKPEVDRNFINLFSEGFFQILV